MRLIGSDGHVSVSLVFAKSRVTPIKPVTVPRLELTAAVLAARCSVMLEKEFKFGCSVKHFFYTDSTVVLGYISNSTRRFQVFVANRVGVIQSISNISQWSHVPGKDNPADVASRGCSPLELSSSIWFSGPSLLHVSGPFDYTPLFLPISENDENVRKVTCHSVSVSKDFYSERFPHISSYSCLVKVVARILKWSRGRKSIGRNWSGDVEVSDLQAAKVAIHKIVQSDLHSCLSSPSFQQFSPFIDAQGVIRVGGRLKRMQDQPDFKHPVILPKDSLFSILVAKHAHISTGHGGKGFTLNYVRQAGYFIVKGVSVVKNLVYKCIGCRRSRSNFSGQLMSDLPDDRVSQSAPFENVGCDFFGPFFIKVKRSIVKRYGCVFTCLYSHSH